jgi:hypothetical protein
MPILAPHARRHHQEEPESTGKKTLGAVHRGPGLPFRRHQPHAYRVTHQRAAGVGVAVGVHIAGDCAHRAEEENNARKKEVS